MAISSIRRSASCGLDGASASTLTGCVTAIVHPLTCIFITSLGEGSFPSDLKGAKVVPILKKGSPLELDNYRPISLLSVFAKVFEYVIDRWLKNECLILQRFSVQHGFTQGRSVE